ncbi:hypothetical protein OAK65_04245 [Synechococcus sp. AH-551-N17]|nr:hypothetical protein [Synechococcus sp. AH-551-N17]
MRCQRYLSGKCAVTMDSTDLEVVNVLVFQQLLESVESESWAEAAMALYKLYDIEAGQDFLDQDDVDDQQLLAA